MARRLATASDYLRRTTGFLAPGSDSTVLLWAKYGTLAAPGQTAYLLIDDPGVYVDYAAIFAVASGMPLEFSGPTDVASGFSPSLGVWYCLGWVQSGTTQSYYIGTVTTPLALVGSTTIDRSAYTIGYELLGNDTFSTGDLWVAYGREWQTALTLDQILAEQFASAAMLATDLFLDTPLVSTLLDISGNSHDWTQVGSGSYAAGPFPATYLDVTGATPYSRVITQAEFNGGTFGGTANQVWFRYYTPTEVAFGGTCNSGGTFTPKTFVYQSDATTEVDHITGAKGWHYVLPAGTYWVKIIRSAGGASDFDFTAQFDTTALDPVLPAGAIVINDDAAGFVATAWQADGTFLGMLTEIPSGETGTAVPTGISVWQDRFGAHAAANSFAVIDTDASYLTSGNTSPVLTSLAIFANTADTFYVLNRSNGVIATITTAGVVADTVATLPAGAYSALGVNGVGTIAYWAEGYASPAIHRHDLSTDTPLSDLYVVPALFGGDVGSIALTAVNENPGEILVLSDDTIVTWYHDVTTDEHVLLQLNPAGAVLQSYPYTGTFQYIDHIHYAPDNPDAIHIWFFETSGASTARIGHLVLATGVLDVSFDTELFSAGVNLAGESIFGPSSSCTMITLIYTSGPPPGSTGTLQIVKVTVPTGSTQAFDFTASGTDIDPTTFSLLDGESQLYSPLPVGDGYTIEETPVPNWTTTYDVSNGSPINNLVIDADLVTLVVVTNTSAAIVVEKETQPATTQVFHFTATGDGLPATFTLTDGESILFDGLAPGTDYSIIETVPADWRVTYVTSNDSANTTIQVDADTVTTLTVTNGSNSREYLIRRERIFPHLSQEQVRQFFHFLQLDLETGVGLKEGQGVDPQIMLSWSDDGGHTWSNEHWVSVGLRGAYRTRALWQRLGYSRDRLFKIAASDPVKWVVINAMARVTAGPY